MDLATRPESSAVNSPGRLISPILSTGKRVERRESPRLRLCARAGASLSERTEGSGGPGLGLGGGLALRRAGRGGGLGGGEVLRVGGNQVRVTLDDEQVFGVLDLGLVGEVEAAGDERAA